MIIYFSHTLILLPFLRIIWIHMHDVHIIPMYAKKIAKFELISLPFYLILIYFEIELLNNKRIFIFAGLFTIYELNFYVF